MLPNFICPGAQKSATTTLYEILKQHPDIYLPYKKELRFFSGDCWKKGIDWYRQQFADHSGERVVGDISPNYMRKQKTVERIYNTLGPDIKLIFLLRNPADRAFSHYRMSVRRQRVDGSFSECIEKEINRIERGCNTQTVEKHVFNGLYSVQIKWFLQYFPKENMKFVLFENFTKNTEAVCKDIFRFLGVEENPQGIAYDIKAFSDYVPGTGKVLKFKKKALYQFRYRVLRRILSEKLGILSEKRIYAICNRLEKVLGIKKKKIKSRNVPKIKAKDRKRLLEYYRDDIKTLEEIVDKDLSQWYKTGTSI